MLEEQVASLIKGLAAAQAEIADLKAQLAQNSRNSSRPPSADPPCEIRLKSEPTGRKPGGQPGHVGVTRKLLPPDK